MLLPVQSHSDSRRWAVVCETSALLTPTPTAALWDFAVSVDAVDVRNMPYYISDVLTACQKSTRGKSLAHRREENCICEDARAPVMKRTVCMAAGSLTAAGITAVERLHPRDASSRPRNSMC